MEKREWKTIEGFDFKEILFESYNGIAKITINRPRYRNAFTPRTTWEMSRAFAYCREAQDISVVILTGAGDKAFCSGGDMNVKGRGGYVGEDGVPRLNVLDVQKQILRHRRRTRAPHNVRPDDSERERHLRTDGS